MFYNSKDRFVNYLILNWVPILLILLSLYDLRTDLRILFDFFTFSSLIYTLTENPLPITVLLTVQTLFKSLKAE